jgi:hypothetical protein
VLESHHVGRTFIAFLLCPLAAFGQPIRLASPHDGARPQSAYVTIEGEAEPSSRVEVLDGGTVAASLQSDSHGHFERVLRLPAGSRAIRVRCSASEAAVRIEVAACAAPKSPAPYELLRTGDVILAHDRDSQQDALYQPVYTHAAIYIGPDPDGAPRLLEAVTEDLATPRGPIAAVPIEESLAWRIADRVDVFRLPGDLAPDDRARIVEWARRTANRGLPFRTSEFGDIYRAWLLWDPKTDKPRDAAEFDRLIEDLRARLQATDAYDCATLVWHAYLDNTAGRIDLANPNRVTWAGAMKNESRRFEAILHPLVIVPDSFALSGKLRRVTGE